MPRRKFVAGNWKMNKTPDESRQLAAGVCAGLAGFGQVDVALCPTFISLLPVGEVVKGSPLALGAQNIFWEKPGAYTGEVCGELLVAAGCQYVIIGHSERRQRFGETDATVNLRLKAALTHKLKPIVCVGETLTQRQANETNAVVQQQVQGAFAGLTAQDMATVTIAYEPVWAIGTGVNATPAQAQEVHAFIRGLLRAQFGSGVADATRIQYGGSVKGGNARELLSQPDIDGALVGGASLVADEFIKIVKAAV